MTTDTLAVPSAPERHVAKRSASFVEFMAVGGATLILLPLAFFARRAFGLEASELAVGFLGFHAAYVVNDPHFSVTYLLFYEDFRKRAFGRDYGRAQRVRYCVAGIVAPAALAVWAVVALATRSAQALGWMVQLMFLLVGWHYTKQGFGVLSVLCARRSVFLSARERTAILAHCYAAWAFAWANPATAAGEFEEKGLVYFAPAHPRALEIVCGVALAVTTAFAAYVLAPRFRRGGAGLPPLPVTAFVVTVFSWTIFSAADPLLRYLIPALHSIQYFYFVWLLKRNEAREREGPPSFGRPVGVQLGLLAISALALGWLLFRGAPTFFDAAIAARWRGTAAAETLGPTPFFAAFFVFVNIHHYFMDHVIWRRENPATRFLRA